MLRAGGVLRARLGSHPAAGRHGAGLSCRPVLMLVGGAALMTWVPTAASAQCWGTFGAIASVIGTVNTAFLPSGSAFVSSAPSGAPGREGGGVWTRAVAGTVETQSNTDFNALFMLPTGPFHLNAPCRTSIRQNYAGFEVGHDIAAFNTGSSEWHFGALAGYIGAKAGVPAQGIETDAQSGVFNAPSAGLYAVFSKGGFSADAQGRLYELQGESLGQRVDAHGFSVTGNMSYSFALPGNWTLEPSVGGVFSRTSVDQVDFANSTNPLVGLPPIPLVPGGSPATALVNAVMQIHDIDSALGRASVKLGTSVPLFGGQIVAYPFLTASVYHEFEGAVTASLRATGTLTDPSTGTFPFQGGGTLTANSIGTYGQFSGGSAIQLADTGWLGFARVDYRTGSNIQGVSGSVGLRYQLDDTRHVAENRASYPVKAMKAAPAGGYDWTGVYAGASVGSTWGHTHWAFQGDAVAPDFAGVLGGAQAGYNYQTGQLVWGIEADVGASNARGSTACPNPNQPTFVSCQDDVGALGFLTGRLGYASGRALFYAKSGWAFGKVTAGPSMNLGAPPEPVVKSTNWENGWTAGVGVEFALTDLWSAKAEYLHYGFPQYAFTVAPNAISNVSTVGDAVRIGVNYHFGR